MKKLLLILTIALLVSCKKDITSLNVNTKEATKVPAEGLFANGVKDLADRLASTNVNSNIFRLITQQWTQTTYIDESRYNLVTRKIPDGLFNVLYRDVLRNFQEAKTVASTNATQVAIADIMQVYAYNVLVCTYGDIPYSQALNYANITPQYDDAKYIMYDLLKRLTDDIAALNASTSTGYGSSDLIYSGNINAWKKFANTLKLKIAMQVIDGGAPPTSYSTALFYANEAIASGVFTSNVDNALLKYMSVTPNTNPLWVDLVQSGRTDFVASKTIVDIMNNLSDPRRPLYFTQVSSAYSGGINGTQNSYRLFSAPSTLLRDPTVPSVFLDYAELEFLLAEAAERGFTVGGTAQSHYNAGIQASIAYWYALANAAGIPNTGTTDATTAGNTYISQTSVDYTNGASGATYQQKIGQQKYLALYNRGFDAWTEWRRLKFPTLTPATGALSVIPRRFTYPIKEQNINGVNYNAAASRIGGDNVGTRLFWDMP